MASENGMGRLDRIEKALELLIDDHVQFREEHKMLLAAQVVLTDRLDRFVKENADAQKRIDQKLAELAEAQKLTDQKLAALIEIADDLIRRRPPE